MSYPPPDSSIHRHFLESAPGIDVEANTLDWPYRGAASGDDFCGNQSYRDLRGLGWQHFQAALARERATIAEYEAMGPDDRRYAEEEWPDDYRRIQDLISLEVGVASLVIAISAAGGVPFSSCNGSAFYSEGHLEPVPVVGFYWPLTNLGVLEECVIATRTQLWSNARGQFVASGEYITRMIDLAEEIHQRRDSLAPPPPLRERVLRYQP